MSTCPHEFTCSVGVAIFEDKPGNGGIEVKGHCTKCGLPLIFYGPRGAAGSYPMASFDRTTLRAPVTFGYEPKFDPLPDMTISGPELHEPPKH